MIRLEDVIDILVWTGRNSRTGQTVPIELGGHATATTNWPINNGIGVVHPFGESRAQGPKSTQECASISRIYGLYDECRRRYNVKLWKCGLLWYRRVEIEMGC